MLRRAIALVLVSTTLVAAAQTVAPPENVVHLSAQSTVEVEQDWLAVVFSTTVEGPEAAAVQAQVKRALDAALSEARKGARAGEVEVRTGQFSLYPRQAPKGGSQGWIGRAELIVEGRDVAHIAQLSGRIQTMTIARLGYSLSREARERVEGDVAAQAIERFRAKAAQTARQFGFTGFLLREVHLSSNDGQRPVALTRSRMASASIADDALPTEAGRATVSASVQGSIQLTR